MKNSIFAAIQRKLSVVIRSCTYSPVIRLQECLLRHAAHDRGWCMSIRHVFANMHEVMMLVSYGSFWISCILPCSFVASLLP